MFIEAKESPVVNPANEKLSSFHANNECGTGEQSTQDKSSSTKTQEWNDINKNSLLMRGKWIYDKYDL